MNYPDIINDLIEGFKKFSGIGEKTAERLALSTLEMDDEVLQIFSEALKNVKKKIKRCKRCNYLTEEDFCVICKDDTFRDKTTICVVEEPKIVTLFEKMGGYHGLYHVLDGLISPLDGVSPEDIHIASLIERIKNEKIHEVIIAVKPSVEGETTALYISKLLEGMNVVVSKIAHGVPIGIDMEYIDSLTLEMALEDRKNVA
jgi:recombination protein RecR